MTKTLKTALAALERLLVPVAAAGLLFSAVFGIPLAIGVWLPDLFATAPRTLAEQSLPSGHRFQVIQYWNHEDFYNTELLHTLPGGTVRTYVLDADDCKHWRVGPGDR